MWSQIVQFCASLAKVLNVALFAKVTATFIEFISIVIIAWGVLLACYRMILLGIQYNRGEVHLRGGWLRMRRAFGESMLLGLQFLVAADIILTIGHPDLMTVGILAAVVLIRVVLSITLAKEISEMKEIAEFEEKHHLPHL